MKRRSALPAMGAGAIFSKGREASGSPLRPGSALRGSTQALPAAQLPLPPEGGGEPPSSPQGGRRCPAAISPAAAQPPRRHFERGGRPGRTARAPAGRRGPPPAGRPAAGRPGLCG